MKDVASSEIVRDKVEEYRSKPLVSRSLCIFNSRFRLEWEVGG